MADMEIENIPYIFYEIIGNISDNDISIDAQSSSVMSESSSEEELPHCVLPISLLRFPFRSNINSQIVECLECERDLDFYEILSMCFLLYEDEYIEMAYQRLEVCYKTYKTTDKGYPLVLTEWARIRELADDRRWQEKFIEALALIQNFLVLEKLGYYKGEIKQKFLCNRLISSEVCLLRKALFHIAESLSDKEIQRLIDLSVQDLKNRGFDYSSKYEAEFLEMYLLHWNSVNYINFRLSFRDEIDVRNLVKHLKVLERDDLVDYLADVLKTYAHPCQIHIYSSESSGSQWSSAASSIEPQWSNEPSSLSAHSEVSTFIQGFTEPESSYRIDPKNIGLCIIINLKHFYKEPDLRFENCLPAKRLESRIGTDVDRDRLIDMFSALGFEIILQLSSLNHVRLENFVKLAIKEKFKPEYCCFVLCVLSHGKEGAVYASNSVPVPVRRLETIIHSSRHLKRKPKLLIIQACQGAHIQNAYVQDIAEDGPSHSEYQVVPEISDQFTFWSTIPGFASFRDMVDGSWFVKALINGFAFQKNGDNIDTISKRVNKSLSNKYMVKEGKPKAMMPVYNSTLTNDLCLPLSLPNKKVFITQLIYRQLLRILFEEYFYKVMKNINKKEIMYIQSYLQKVKLRG